MRDIDVDITLSPMQHVLLVMRLLIAHSIPDVPLWVAQEKARLEFLRREESELILPDFKGMYDITNSVLMFCFVCRRAENKCNLFIFIG